MKRRRPNPRRRAAPRWSVTEWVEAGEVLQRRSGGACEARGCPLTPYATERHHRQKRTAGGDTYANLLLLCRDCHQSAHAHPEEARRMGWIVSISVAWDQVTEVPVCIQGAWRLLDAEGNMRPADSGLGVES